MKRNFAFALVAGAGVTIAGPGLAAELLANGNFETGTFAGWSTFDTGGGAANSYFVIPNGGNLPASGQGTQVNPGGGNFVAVGDQFIAGGEVLLQSFTTPGGQLTLTFDWFNKTNFAQFGSAIDGSTQSARVDILFNGASPFDVGAGVADNLMLNEGTLTDPSTTIPWELASFTITGLSAGTYELRFGNGQCCNFQQFGVDNVSLTTSVPEPQTWSLMLLGFAALGYSGYRRAHSAPKMNNLT